MRRVNTSNITSNIHYRFIFIRILRISILMKGIQLCNILDVRKDCFRLPWHAFTIMWSGEFNCTICQIPKA